jgi:WD40 repeat protein
MFRPPLRRPGRSDTDVTVMALLLVLLLVLLGGGGAVMVWQFRHTQMARAEAEMAAQMALQEREEARFEAERARALEQAHQKEKRVQDVLREGQPHPAAPCLEEGLKLAGKGEVNEALLWFARGLEQSGNDLNQQRLFRANLAAWGQARAKPRDLFRAKGPIMALAPSPDGKVVLVGSEDGSARLAPIDGGMPKEVPPDADKVSAVGFSADGRQAFVANGRQVRRVEAASGQPVGEPLEAPGEVLAIATTADGKVMMCGTCEQGVWLSEGGQRQGATRLFAADSPVQAVALGSDGKLTATGHEDGTAQLWGADRKPLGAAVRPGAPVAAVALSTDGALLATAAGKKVRLWDATTRQQIGTPLENGDDVLSLSFRADGKSLLAGDRAGAVRLITVPAPVAGDVQRLKLWAEVTARAKLDAGGKVQPLADAEVLELRKKLQALGGPPTP